MERDGERAGGKIEIERWRDRERDRWTYRQNEG